MMTSLQTNEWKVPTMNFRINISSMAVCEGRNPSCKFAVSERKKKSERNNQFNCLRNWRIVLNFCALPTYSNSMNSTICVQQLDMADWPFRMSMVDLVLVLFYICRIVFSNTLPMHEYPADWIPMQMESTENRDTYTELKLAEWFKTPHNKMYARLLEQWISPTFCTWLKIIRFILSPVHPQMFGQRECYSDFFLYWTDLRLCLQYFDRLVWFGLVRCIAVNIERCFEFLVKSSNIALVNGISE